MIKLLHGEDTSVSRRELDRIRSEFSGEILMLDGKNASETDLIQAMESNSLFEEKKLIVIDNFFSSKRKIEINLENIQNDVVFWEDRELPKTILEGLKNVKAEIFKVSPLIFKLVDSLSPGNGPKCVELLRLCLKTTEAEYVSAMVVRQFRLMINPGSLPPWQAGKISVQVKAFGQPKPNAIYKKLLDIDYQNKQGLLPFDLSFALELFFLSL